ncbi:protein FAM53C isoform X2 [Alligator mississippiensis]|nr:protein FAM53C isoform X2 [Alligator mississippiensis]
MSERASWRDRLLCPRIHLQDNVSFGYRRPSLGLPPRGQSSCPPGSPVSPALAADPRTSEKASVPPSKRHCRSLSVPEDLSRWRPLGSRVWTAVQQRRSGAAGALAAPRPRQPPPGPGPGPPSTPPRPRSPPFFSLALALPREAWDGGEAPQPFPLQRRFSLSPRSSASCAPAPRPRSRSQPCDLGARKSGLKRRHDERVSRRRPALDFHKMNQVGSAGRGRGRAGEAAGGADARARSQTQLPGGARGPAPAPRPCSPPGGGAARSGCGSAEEDEEEDEEEEEERGRRWAGAGAGPEEPPLRRDLGDLDLALIEEN